MIDLSERLSEFSYGYGVTREVERLLESVGVNSVPFFPSLLQEAKLGFDVGFNKPGIPLLLQFKLSSILTRFVRTDLSQPAPEIGRPFWRFCINTAEPDGQYETLLKAEFDGAEVYYVAPKLFDWPDYLRAFSSDRVLDRSVLINPRAIRMALESTNQPDGSHRIVYDELRSFVCTKPVLLSTTKSTELPRRLLSTINERKETLGEHLRRIYEGMNDRQSIRRPLEVVSEVADEEGALSFAIATSDLNRISQNTISSRRTERFNELLRRTDSKDAAIALNLGAELWATGVQMFYSSVE